MSYHEVSSAQIVLSEPDTVRHFVREVRGGVWSRVEDALRALADAVPIPGRRRPWPRRAVAGVPDVRVVALCLVGVSFLVALCFVLAADPPPTSAITASPIAPVASLPPAASTVSRERVLDTEPHGANVYRSGSRIGTTPLLYEMPENDPLGSIDLRLDGFRTEHRFIDESSPRILVIPLRRR